MGRAQAREISVGTLALLAAVAACGVPQDDQGSLLDEAAGARSAAFQNGVAPSASYAGNRDTTLAGDAPSRNFGADTTCQADGDAGNGLDAACVMAWNLGAIPAGSIVRTVSLQITVTNAAGRAGSTYQLYALKRSWDEASASWNRASTATAWQTAGARGANDRDTTVLGTVTANSTGRYTVALNADGVAAVQRWVNDPASNFGFVLANPTTMDGLTFASSEAATASNRPRLNVSYDPADTDAGTITDAARDGGPAPTDAARDGGPAPTDSGTDAARDGGPAPTDSGTTGTRVETLFGAAFNPTTDAYFDQLRQRFGGVEVRRSYDGSSGVAPYLNKYQGQDVPRNAASSYSFKYPPAEVIAGTHDAALRNFFQGLQDDHPVYWTYWHEPDEDIYVEHRFTPTAYRNAWAHIRRIADQVRATRPRLRIYATFIIMAYSLTDRVAPNRPLLGDNGMYPGDAVIEVFGVDGYNTAAKAGDVRNVAGQWGNIIDFAQAHHKPWAIGELGSCPVDGDPQGRAAYLRESFQYWKSRNYPPVFVAYFNVDWPSCDYRMENDPNALTVWRQAVSQGIWSF